MSMIQSDLLLGQEGGAGYTISRSLRFNSSDSAYLSRTFSSPTNNIKWTWCGWVKRSKLSTDYRTLFNGNSISTNYASIEFSDTDNIRVYNRPSSAGGVTAIRTTSAVFRDTSAWYHIMVAWDSANATAADRLILYVNGTRVTAFSSSTDPTSSEASVINSAIDHGIGRQANYNGYYFDGYLADVFFIDGQALTPSSFTETSATTGQLIPKAYSGSFGTNGFWLKFSDNSAATATTLGKDYSGNSNNWTPNNFSTSTGGPTSVASASGALPIFNTTDTYGAVKGTGTRTDASSASLVLALSMDGTNGGTTFTDESATIRGSGSAKTITVTNTTTSTSEYKFYGSAALCGSGRVLTASSSADFNFGTGDFTIEYWLYRTSLGLNDSAITNFSQVNSGYLICLHSGTGYNDASLYLNGSVAVQGGTPQANVWNHYAYVRSGTTCTIYKNGVAIASATSSAQAGATNVMNIGAYSDGSSSISGYMQDVRIYKGLAKYTSNFNPPSSTQNPTVAAGFDSTVDTPSSAGTDTGLGGQVTGNYATLNPLDTGTMTIANGNLEYTRPSNGYSTTRATIGVSSGKWYWEQTIVGSTSAGIFAGLTTGGTIPTYPGETATSYGYDYAGPKWNNGSSTSYGTSYTTGDVIGVAFDADNGKLYFAKNGTWQNSGNPASGTNAAFTGLTSGPYFPLFSAYLSGSGSNVNFGQRQWAYAAPSGFRPLVDTLLPAPVVAKSSDYFQAVLYTGNGSTQTVSGLSFSPDLVWLKGRSVGYSHQLYDQVRGAGKLLGSNTTNAESTVTDNLTAFTSSGFTLGNDAGTNQSSATYVAWAFDAGSNTVSNTAGSITSQVRANASAGFSIVGFAGTGTTGTVGHGLGVAPAFIIGKNRDSGSFAWRVYHSALGGTKTLYLNLTNAAATDNDPWNDTSPTSTTISLLGGGALNRSGNNTILYCFSPVAGYSSAFSYTGTNSSEGPFVHLGFKPRLILVKRTDAAQNWFLFDSARNTYNSMGSALFPNLSDAENTGNNDVDFLSNGFKIRFSGTSGINQAGTYIGFAWAENPFAYARAR